MIEEIALYMEEEPFDVEQQVRRQMIHELNGHFLFNALTVIMVMTRKEPLCARELEREFGDYLRGVMTRVGGTQEWIPLSKELKAVRAYLHIQSVRFEQKFTYEISIKNENTFVPAGVLQDLVENAVGHGIRHKTEGGLVHIEQEITGEKQYLYVTDNGKGFNIDALDAVIDGGISHARSMLEQVKGAALEVFSMPSCGTQAKLILPLKIQIESGECL